jgi:hypothetical protein
VKPDEALRTVACITSLLMATVLGSARATETCEVSLVVTGADNSYLTNALGERCPCAESAQRPIAGCGSNDGVVLRHRSPEETKWPRVTLSVQGQADGELFVSAKGTGRPITVTATVKCAEGEREAFTTLRRARAGTTYWWKATWLGAGSGQDVRVGLRRLRRVPQVRESH